jgi:chemotaxis protein methyltransferase CheR
MDCIALLQWALPQLDLQWSGFRKVRRQVCKRLKRRITELQLDNFAAYRARLAVNPAEWIIFDQCCHITISRFFRDKGLFETVRRRVLPEIAVRAKREQRDARIWSAGCASGEEPYSLKILRLVLPIFQARVAVAQCRDRDGDQIYEYRQTYRGCIPAEEY